MSEQLDIFGFDESQLEEVKIDNPNTLAEVFNNIAADMVKMFGFRMIATLFMADYYDYVNKGVRGIGGNRKSGNLKGQGWELKAPNSPYQFKRGPSVSHIRQWAKSKGLNEYAVRTSIAHKGTRPRFFFDNCMQETFYGEAFNRFKTDIRVVSGERIAKGLKEILE